MLLYGVRTFLPHQGMDDKAVCEAKVNNYELWIVNYEFWQGIRFLKGSHRFTDFKVPKSIKKTLILLICVINSFFIFKICESVAFVFYFSWYYILKANAVEFWNS